MKIHINLLQEIALVEISGRTRRRYQTSSSGQEVSVSTSSEGGQEFAGGLGDFVKGEPLLKPTALFCKP